MNRISGCERIAAINIALRRPKSLRLATRRSAIDAAKVCESASEHASLILTHANAVDGASVYATRIGNAEKLRRAFAHSMTRHETVTQRIRDAESAVYEERKAQTTDALCELRLVDIYEDELNGTGEF